MEGRKAATLLLSSIGWAGIGLGARGCCSSGSDGKMDGLGGGLSWLGGDGWVERVDVLEIRFVVGFPLVVVSSGS